MERLRGHVPIMTEQFSEAILAWQRGDNPAALAGLRALSRQPNAPRNVFEALADISLECGLLGEAEDANDQAIRRDPAEASAWHRRATIEMQRGNLEGARIALEEVARLLPLSAPARNNLGAVLQQLGFAELAVQQYRQAVAIDPSYADAHANLAATFALAGFLTDAVAHAHRAVALRPDEPAAYVHAAFAESDRENFDEALAWFDRMPPALRQLPAVQISHAEVLVKADRHQEALEVCAQLLAQQPGFADAYLCRGTALAALGRGEEALAAFDRAAELDPKSALPLARKGVALMELARSGEAAALFDKARAIAPLQPNILYMRAAAKEFKLDESEIAELEHILARDRFLSALDRLHLHFTLGSAYLGAGRNEKVFEHLDAGNRLKRALVAYDADGVQRHLVDIAATFPEGAPATGGGASSRRPIFVIGVPRSGTTLVEQILASHPLVHGGGEMRALAGVVRAIADERNTPFPYFVPELTDADYRRIGEDYLERVGRPPAGKEFIVDKMPSNALFAGLINRVLPDARIILCRRNPIDTCFSCYSRLFTARQNFTYNLVELGRYYRMHDAVMGHWKRILPEDRFLEVNYEDVVDDIDTMARRIVAFCGLEWSDDCLRFYESTRPVRTSSMLQVRQPLYRGSIGRWRPFRNELAPLIEALGIAVPD